MGNVNQKPHQNLETAQLLEDQDSSSSSSSSSFTCEICTEPVIHPNKRFNNSNRCIHPFCTECMIKYIQTKLEENVSDIKCPALTCDHSLDPLSCRSMITHQLFDKWCDVLFESAVLGFNTVYCPNRDCSVLVINECRGDLKKCVCPNCKKPFCFRCKIAWHAGYRCEEIGEIKDQNDVAFGVLSEEKRWMRCPGCRHCVERVTGCSFVKCRCGNAFCYRCGRKRRQCTCYQYISFCMACFLILFGVVIFVYGTKLMIRSLNN